jgi:hypothetical protein
MSEKVYQQTGDYIPQTDAGFRDFLANFSTLISADPSRYGLEAADAAIIASMNTSFAAAYVACQSPATRTSGLVTQKDALRASATASCRVYAQQVKVNQGVDNQDKIELGLHINDPTPTPIPAPTTAPMLGIVSAFSGEQTIRYADELTPASRKKPAGAIQLELYVHVGPTPIVDYTQATFVGVYTKNPIQYEFTPDQANMTASYFARWRTQRGLVGPWSLPVAMGIAFGGPVDQQMPTGGTQQTAGGDEQLKIAA